MCVCVGGGGGGGGGVFESQLNKLQMWNEHTCNSHLRQNCFNIAKVSARDFIC